MQGLNGIVISLFYLISLSITNPTSYFVFFCHYPPKNGPQLSFQERPLSSSEFFDALEILGIIEPIKSGMRDPKLGIGKQEEDDYFTAEENIQRRKLDIEVEETEEVAKKREVIAEREQKIQTEVKEIHKVFFCHLCNKQYKLAMEFEAHLSSYDHNHRKRFKEMREMHGSNRDDRQKREQQRQEKEMANTDARKQQLQDQEPSGSSDSSATKGVAIPLEIDQRKALKFGFSAKSGLSKKPVGDIAKKPKVPVASVFGDDSDEEEQS
ncbi:hypothetical protein KSS87_023402 [Heliosperma pusillum]|nr:hypothetical protein KSS87_023402 [Heliosperma pusillum]